MLVNIDTSPQLQFGLDSLPTANRGYYIYVTEACNLRCSYCFVTDKMNHRHLTPEVAQKVLDFIKIDGANLKDAYVHFFGGEPLIRATTVDFLASELRIWAKERGKALKFGITTNGTLLTIANCDMLKRHNVGVQLSLDGSKEGNNVHRQVMGGDQRGLRSAGAFDLVQYGNYISYFGGKNPNCRMTLTIHNLPYLTQSIRELRDLGFRSFSIIPDTDCGAWSGDYLALYEQEIEKLFEYWSTHKELHINLIELTMAKLRQPNSPTHLCQAGRTVLGITVDGDIYPCHDFSGKFSKNPAERARLLIGNVEKGFTSNQYSFENLAVDDRIKSGNGYDCETCFAKTVCSRGCPYINYAHSGDVHVVNPSYCSTTRINTAVAKRWMPAMSDSASVATNGTTESFFAVARAALNAMGGEEKAPFGRNKDGKALLPGPGMLRRLGYDYSDHPQGI